MITLDGLTLYRGHRGVLDIPHLQIHPGERVALLGPSGNGKTTLLRAIAGLESPHAGRIRLADQTVWDAGGTTNVPPAGRAVGLLSQDYGLWPHLTAAQHIAFAASRGRHLRLQPADTDWLHRVGLGHQLDALPSRLSGGEQQRLALARTLASRPRLLLLDEPFANVDRVLARELLNLLDDLHPRRELTRLMVTHDVAEAVRHSDRLLILRDGRLLQQGDWAAITAQPADDWVGKLVEFSRR